MAAGTSRARPISRVFRSRRRSSGATPEIGIDRRSLTNDRPQSLRMERLARPEPAGEPHLAPRRGLLAELLGVVVEEDLGAVVVGLPVDGLEARLDLVERR